MTHVVAVCPAQTHACARAEEEGRADGEARGARARLAGDPVQVGREDGGVVELEEREGGAECRRAGG